ncbi:unnamed protein product [Lactuca saligna]|uniref:RRM domain-containing protein n=1 Tax=Lactuca saligna TaxID=75948 RepID=A0AA35ZHW2_LACSI|nr:unnamed protein product [Lactuca saligna]
MCNRLGKVVDVFISNKKSQLGKRFGFVRFMDVTDTDRMIRELCNIWFGYHKLFAAVPRLSKKSKSHAPHATEGNSRVNENSVGNSVTYANVVKGVGGKFIPNKKDEVIQVSAGDFIVEKTNRACLIKGRDFLTLPNLQMLCYDEGFEDFDIWYVGGLWVMLEFKHKDACKKFLASDAMDHWIDEKRPWDRNFVPLERLIWVDVEGLPLRAWSKQAFKNILAKWGNILHLDDDLGENVYKKRICILSSFQEIISQVIKVSIDGQYFWVRIKQARGWTPSFTWEDKKASSENSNENCNALEDLVDNIHSDNEEGSLDPFGIYETLEKMKGDERHGREFNTGANYEEIKVNDSNKDCESSDHMHEEEVSSAADRHQQMKDDQFPQQYPTVTVPAAVGNQAKGNNLAVVRESDPAVAPTPSSASAMESHFYDHNQEGKASRTKAPIGFSGGFGRVSGVADSEDDLTHPPGFSKCNSFGAGSDNSINKGSFLTEIHKTLEMGKDMGYNLEGCYDRVKEIVEGTAEKMMLR